MIIGVFIVVVKDNFLINGSYIIITENLAVSIEDAYKHEEIEKNTIKSMSGKWKERVDNNLRYIFTHTVIKINTT